MSGHQQVNGNINSFNVSNTNNIVNFVTDIDTEGRQILLWLSPLEPQQRHQGVRIDRLDGVGNWVLETAEFRKWSNQEAGNTEQVLFCWGNPGVGKTYLSSLIIDNLCDQGGRGDIAVVGLYCDFLVQHEQSATNILGAILKQLVGRGGIPEYVRESFQKAKREFGGRGLRLHDLIEILKRIIASQQRVFICIDALDESAPKHRQGVLESLREIIRMSPNTRIFLTGRPHIDDEIVKCFGEVVRIPVSPTQGDIEYYLERRLDGDTDPNAMNGELRADIMRVIPAKISEIFLLVSLNMDAILGEVTLHQRRKKLYEMTSGEGLGDAYAITLSRMKAQQRSKSKLGMEVLMWISHSERPLHVDELCHALGVEEGSTDLNIENIPAIETLLACSLGLVTIEKSSSTVRLIHYTLQEYLSYNTNLFLKPHSTMAEVCLTYLNFPSVGSFSSTCGSLPPAIPFIKYASCHWGTHARQETTESVKTLALKLLDGYDRHISSKMLLLHGMDDWERPLDRGGSHRGFSGLHGAAYFGCEEIAVALLEMKKWDMQATDSHGNTAIGWAARRGHSGVVRILLERNNIDPNTADTRYGRTLLSWAAGNGHQGVVTMLLQRSDINPDAADTIYGRTPLSWAARNGQEGVVGALLDQKDVTPDAADTSHGRTPLSWAARNGHEGVVRMLLERNDINPDAADTFYGQTPLSWAAENGHSGVVRLLLERNDISPDSADARFRRTPLLWAARNGHVAVVRMLLERNDVNPDVADTRYGQTPLSWAARNGHVGVVGMLLERNEIDPDAVDTEYGQTPLSWAARKGHEGVVRTLLERDDINPDSADTRYRRTPLLWAARNGHEGVVRMLLERNVNPNATDTFYGQTPLSLAAEYGREGAVRMLLERNDVNPDAADTKYSRTPLWWATCNGHEKVVRMLLERNDINPNAADTKYGQTPLSWAARYGREGVVRILLERNDINPDAADTEHGRTPLQWATLNGHMRIAKILRELVNLIPRCAASLQSTETPSPDPHRHSEPPIKRPRRF